MAKNLKFEESFTQKLTSSRVADRVRESENPNDPKNPVDLYDKYRAAGLDHFTALNRVSLETGMTQDECETALKNRPNPDTASTVTTGEDLQNQIDAGKNDPTATAQNTVQDQPSQAGDPAGEKGEKKPASITEKFKSYDDLESKVMDIIADGGDGRDARGDADWKEVDALAKKGGYKNFQDMCQKLLDGWIESNEGKGSKSEGDSSEPADKTKQDGQTAIGKTGSESDPQDPTDSDGLAGQVLKLMAGAHATDTSTLGTDGADTGATTTDLNDGSNSKKSASSVKDSTLQTTGEALDGDVKGLISKLRGLLDKAESSIDNGEEEACYDALAELCDAVAEVIGEDDED